MNEYARQRYYVSGLKNTTRMFPKLKYDNTNTFKLINLLLNTSETVIKRELPN